jgi:hypothetical protein
MRPILVLGFLLAAVPAAAHQAASGWSYDAKCCGGRDCREIDDTAVAPATGGWLIKASNEIFPYRLAKPSPDGRFHRCSLDGAETSMTICLYAPPMGQ